MPFFVSFFVYSDCTKKKTFSSRKWWGGGVTALTFLLPKPLSIRLKTLGGFGVTKLLSITYLTFDLSLQRGSCRAVAR